MRLLSDMCLITSFAYIARMPWLPLLVKCWNDQFQCNSQSFFATGDLQFGYKSKVSASMCTGFVKNVVSHYVNRGSFVYGCFPDASKAFDLVDHNTLFQHLLDRELPSPILKFLLSWYRDQQMSVRWNSCLSSKFTVSNGIRQGGVLSPILFTLYLDKLIYI